MPQVQSIRPRSYNYLALVTPNFSLRLASKPRLILLLSGKISKTMYCSQLSTPVSIHASLYHQVNRYSDPYLSVKTDSLVSSDLTTNTTFAAAALEEYKQSKLGPYTSPTGEFLEFLPLTTYSNASAQIHAAALKQNSSTYLPATTPAEVQKG